MKYCSFIIALIAFAFQIYVFNANAYDNTTTHRYINEMAVKNKANIDSYLMTSLGMNGGIDTMLGTKPIWEWIVKGGFEEDKPSSRCLRHFHDPLEENWDEAGLLFFTKYDSMIYWAQAPYSENDDSDNKYSWQWAKEYYHKALLTGSEEYYAKTFRSLGQVMHLVSDAAVPAHVRNDPHPIIDPYERWVENHPSTIKNLEYKWFSAEDTIFDKAVSNSSAPSPISALWDHDEYLPDGSNMPDGFNRTIGLAEYTNANFWTEDTMNDYPHPSFEDINFDEDLFREVILAENSESHNRFYLSKQNGDPIDHFFTVRYWFYHLSESSEYDDAKKEALRLTYTLDDVCCIDYAKKLIPRAIGYSAALLDYFFRGSIEITLPSKQYHSGVYSMIEDPDQGFAHIILNARNITPSGEKMTGGSIELVVKYKLTLNGEDPFQSKYIETTESYSYITAEAKNISEIPRNESVELEFELKEALPINATDVTINLVYRGALGNEQDAIAVGYKDISEPTPLDFFSNLDKICLAGGWLDAGSDDAIRLVDENGNGISDENEIDVYPHDVKDYYTRLSSISDPQAPLQDPEDIHIPEIKAGEFRREVFFLGDDELALSRFSLWSPCSDPNDGHSSGSQIPLGTDTLKSFKRQTYWLTAEECSSMGEDPGCSVRRYPSFTSFRGVEMHGVIITYEDESWGHDNTCSLDNLN